MSLLSSPVPQDVLSLTAAMERLHRPRGPYVSYLSPTDEPFIEFVSHGRPDLTVAPVLFFTVQAAIDAYWRNFIALSHGSPGTRIYWRVKPTLESAGCGPINIENCPSFVGSRVYKIYSRFLLSSKPIVSKQFEEKCLGTYKSVSDKKDSSGGDVERKAVQKVAS